MIPELLDTLLRTPGPSGQEAPAAAAWRDWCASVGAEVGVDQLGSSWARLPAPAAGPDGRGQSAARVPTVAVAGHIDEIGVHVTHIDEKGFLRFAGIGGWDRTVLVGQRVVLSTQGGPVLGVIARKPVHLLDGEQRKQAPELKDLQIDIGASSAQEAASLVRIGDAGVIDAAPLELRNGRMISKAIDNRAGCYVAARALQLVAEAGDAQCELLALAVTQEETTFSGSATSGFRHMPDVLIAVDTAVETDQPGVELGEMSPNTFGSGPSIGRGPLLHPVVFELLCEAAQEESIPFTVTAYGRETGTDADAFHLAGTGIPTALVELPIRYMHTPVEMVELADVEAAARLIASFSRRFTAETPLAR